MVAKSWFVAVEAGLQRAIVQDALRERAVDERLPWDFIDHAVERRYLLAERRIRGGDDTPGRTTAFLRAGISDGTTSAFEGGWQLPRDPAVVVDHDYVLAAAGLLGPQLVVARRREGAVEGPGVVALVVDGARGRGERADAGERETGVGLVVPEAEHGRVRRRGEKGRHVDVSHDGSAGRCGSRRR